jgi:N-methylhydantoinase B
VLPDGEYTFEDRIDEDPLAASREPVVIRLRFTKTGDELVFDFTATDPDPTGALGCSRAFTCSGVYLAVLNLFPGIPFNHGVVRNCRVLTRPGTATEAIFPSSVSGAASGAFEKVLGAVFGALGRADPSRQVGGTCNLMNIVVGGTDPRHHRPYVLYVWNEGGYGGSPRGDGGDSPTLYPYATGSRNQPVEVHERLYPVRYHKVEIRYDSCGAGTFRGGPGIVHRLELTDGQAVLSCWGDRERYPPWGVNGGLPGGGHHVFVNPDTPQEKSLGMFWTGERLKAGDVFEAISSGGGGWGDPRARDPDLVLHDVAEGMLDIETAAEVYGVAIVCHDPRRRLFDLDSVRTAQLRGSTATDSQTDRSSGSDTP